MELRHLRYFIAVAEELHFTRAAARLHMAQPPLSQQIRQLEQELGVELFERSRHEVRLTDAGGVFLDRARRVLEAEEDARWSAQRAGLGEVGRIQVGFGGSAALDVLTDVLARHRERFPGVQVVLHELGSHTQMEQLLARRLHVGLLREHAPDDRIAVEVLRREPLVAILPARHPLASRKQLTVRALASEPFVLPPRGQSASYTEAVFAACTQAGFQPRVVQEASETLAILGLVAAGVGVSLLAAGVQKVRARGVVYRPLRAPVPMLELAVAWRRADTSSLVSGFTRTCREVARPREH